MNALYRTTIRHVRMGPERHEFTYDSYWWLVDIDDMPRLPRALRPFARFRATDHGVGSAGTSWRARIDEVLAQHGVEDVETIEALTNPRVLGYVFNPLTVYWCKRRDGSIAVVIAEVHNTYGGRHCYVLHTDSYGKARTDKQFYVSPFNDVSGHYRLSVPLPGESLDISVVLHRPTSAPFIATVVGQREPITARSVLRAQLRAPIAPLAVAVRIRWQGLRLWRKGLPIVPRSARDSAWTASTNREELAR